ncbi:MAG: hypothetical protein MZV70_65180 [Desulfobacterales bacterium]|nr:hypothetical protein [Desulfobacterales bacterium]
MVKLGFIGFGEAAFNIAKGLKGEGLDGIIAYDKFWKDAPGSELICQAGCGGPGPAGSDASGAGREK